MRNPRALAYYLVLSVAALFSIFAVFTGFINAAQHGTGKGGGEPGNGFTIISISSCIYYLVMTLLLAKYTFARRHTSAVVAAVVIIISFIFQRVLEGMYIYYAQT